LLDPARIWIENEHAIAFAPADLIADGHMIIAPRKHVPRVYELAAHEQADVWKLAGEVRDRLSIGLQPGSFDIGFIASATEHDHVHIVPRRHGERPWSPTPASSGSKQRARC
jgi:histidine triad (HIT) family protein